MATNPNVIPVKGPLAIIGVFLSILRARFRPEGNLNWVYQGNSEEDRLVNTISIEAGSNPLPEERNKRPAIYVIRNPISYNQSTIGDSYGTDLNSQTKIYYATAETSFTFIVESDQEGEASQIADIVLCSLMMGSDLIEETFKFRKLGPFAMSAVSKPIYDRTIAQVHISMGLTYDVRWLTIPIAPLLHEIVVKSKSTTYNSSDEYFTEIYQSSI